MLGWGKALEVEAMTLAELKERLLELSPPQKRQLIHFLTDSLGNTEIEDLESETVPLSVFFRQSPLASVASELDLQRDRRLTPDRLEL
jgi:hypothetical protein